MIHDLASLKAALATAPARAIKAELFRLVPFKALVAYTPPQWLYASGKPNRYNPAGVQCVYFGESREAAQAAYEGLWRGISGANQPVVTFCADVSLQRVLDLTDAATLTMLKMDEKELFKKWRTAKDPTLTQLIGLAINETATFPAIRYPTASAAGRKHAWANYVIFRNCVHSPDSVRILGPESEPLDEWP